MNTESDFEDGSGSDGTNTSTDGFYPLCDYCSFTFNCRPVYDEVKAACDDHNSKNPGHNAAPVNCTV